MTTLKTTAIAFLAMFVLTGAAAAADRTSAPEGAQVYIVSPPDVMSRAVRRAGPASGNSRNQGELRLGLAIKSQFTRLGPLSVHEPPSPIQM